MIIDKNDYIYLEHFGVKGMRWGVRKSPEQVRQEREGRAKKFDVRAMDMQTKIDKISKRRFDPFKADKIASLELKKERAQIDAQKKREGKLSTNQKRAAIGAGVAGGILLAYGTYSTLSSGNARRLIGKGNDAIHGRKGLPWKVNSELRASNMSIDELSQKVAAPINPNYHRVGGKMNCRRATFAYEMRRRGYDVQATMTPTGRGQDAGGFYNALHPNRNNVPSGAIGNLQRVGREHITGKAKSPNSLTSFVLNKQGADVKFTSQDGPVVPKVIDHLFTRKSGERGEIGVMANGLPIGHSMAWEVVRGTPVVFDTQSGKKYVGQQISEFFDNFPVGSAMITRLDNKPLDDDFLRRWVRNA